MHQPFFAFRFSHGQSDGFFLPAKTFWSEWVSGRTSSESRPPRRRSCRVSVVPVFSVETTNHCLKLRGTAMNWWSPKKPWHGVRKSEWDPDCESPVEQSIEVFEFKQINQSIKQREYQSWANQSINRSIDRPTQQKTIKTSNSYLIHENSFQRFSFAR